MYSTIFSTILSMAKVEKTLNKMRNNPLNWQIADLEVIAKLMGITMRMGKGSHVSFSHPKWVVILTVPAHCPVKPVYVTKFISLVDMLREEEV
jgi:predicted RNA binding protein YcfA (HicA-like mRNA interferase family)